MFKPKKYSLEPKSKLKSGKRLDAVSFKGCLDSFGSHSLQITDGSGSSSGNGSGSQTIILPHLLRRSKRLRQNPTSFPLPHLTRSSGSSSLFTSTVHLPSSSPPRHCCTLEHPHSLPLSGKMKLIRGLLKSVNLGSPYQFQLPQIVRAFSMDPNSGSDDSRGTNSFESHDDFERRIFGDDGFGSSSKSNAFYQKLERAEKAHDRSGFSSKFNLGNRSEFLDGLDDSFSSLSDGMDAKLKKEATYFEFDPNEIDKDDYCFRPDVPFRKWQTYDTKELDLTKPGVPKPMKRDEFEVTTEEVLRKADFRNVRFLANFLTEAGIIIKRSKTKISAKAQRKVAREIKTARAFGLMPFTTMGTKRFAFGQTMKDLDQDYEYDTYDTRSFVDEDNQDPVRS